MSLQPEPYPDPIIPLSAVVGDASSKEVLLHENACKDCPFPFNVRADPSQPTLVMEIVGIKVQYTFKLPSDLILDAEGTVPTGGWSGGALSRRFYLLPPADGILDLDFTAIPPTGIVIQVVQSIYGHLMIQNGGSADFWAADKPLLGVRIHAAHNTKEFPLTPGRDKPIHLEE